MPDTLYEKALAQPFRVGLMLGALTVPTLWVASEDILRIATSYPLLNSEEVTGYFASGALPGMVLGAGAVRAWAAWRGGNLASARRLLLIHGGLASLFKLAFVGRQIAEGWLRFGSMPPTSYPPSLEQMQMENAKNAALILVHDLPLQLALAMLLLGLFMRSPNA